MHWPLLALVALLSGCAAAPEFNHDVGPAADGAIDNARDQAAGEDIAPADAIVGNPDLAPPLADAKVPSPDFGDPNNCKKSPIVCADKVYPQVNGLPNEAPGSGGCPAGMVKVSTFCIARYEAMLVLDSPSGPAPWSPFQNPGTKTVRALSVAGAVPQGYISQLEAKAACSLAKKRLCTDAEWLRACRGAAQRTYPYGNTRQDGVCNDARKCHPAVQYFESSASWIWGKLDHPCINQLPAGLAKAGAKTGCVSPDGAFDMMGNLHEWTADPAGTFRGGFYVDTKVNGAGCLYRTTAHSAGYRDYSTGFRCCADLP